MKKHRTYRILVLILAVAFIFGIFPPAAFAVLEYPVPEQARVEIIPHEEYTPDCHGQFGGIYSIPYPTTSNSYPERVSITRDGRSDEELSETHLETLEQIQAFRRNRGLIGFEGEYALHDDEMLVSVIVLFKHSPASVQVIEAQMEGLFLAESVAERIVEDEHALFRTELAALFGSGIRGRATGEHYTINREYRRALNGVSISLPSNMVPEVANFQSVLAIYPNAIIQLDLPEIDSLADRCPPGMAPGRVSMRADDMHTLGYKGAGVVVAVLDTGIDYKHPAFAGAFLTLEEMQARNPDITVADTINGIFYGRNFFDDAAENDPMETTPEMSPNGATDHGTHVAGTIVGRDSGGNTSIRGVAPAARMFAYRVLGPGGFGAWDVVIAGIEQIAYDRPDIVNMSLGGSVNSPVHIGALAVNNIMLANPNITFVLSAGNDGYWGHYTVGVPAAATKAITVGSADLLSVGSGSFDKRLSGFSSRGPIGLSHEIKPDIIAHGSDVLSAVPPWSPRNEGFGYGIMSGTSMAAPHVAGAVALLIEYSESKHDGAWASEQLKVRIMNNAIPMPQVYGVFAVGAGYIDVYAAAHNDTVVFVNYDRVPIHPFSFHAEEFAAARTGSFSFGGGRPIEHSIEKSLSAIILNNSEEARTYTIEYRFTENPNNMATLIFSQQSISVGSNAEANFNAVITTAQMEDRAISFEGFVYIKHVGTVVARLPFAFVVPPPRPLENVRLYRPVISTGTHTQNDSAAVLGIYFNHYYPFATDLILYRVTEDGYIPVGDVFGVPGFAGWFDIAEPSERGELRHAILYNRWFWDLEEGDYVLNIQDWGGNLGADIPLRFSVDNTPPELNVEIVLPTQVEQLAGHNDIIISGNVYDAWTEEAAQRGLTFDIWEAADPEGRYSHYAGYDFLALWVYVTGKEPFRVPVAREGSFEITLENAYRESMEIALWAIDNFSLIPEHDIQYQAFGARVSYHWPNSPRFSYDGFLSDLRFPGFVWSGLNITERRIPIGTAELHFDLGGTVSAPTTPLQLAPILLYPGAQISQHFSFQHIIVTREGYRFAGWYLDETFTNRLDTTSRMPAKDTTIFASWRLAGEVRNRYDLEYEIQNAPQGSQTVITMLNSFEAEVWGHFIGEGQDIVLKSAKNYVFTLSQTSRSARHFNVWGTLTIEDVVLQGPQIGVNYSGGVNVWGGGHLIMRGSSSITSNRADRGGGVAVNSGGTFTMEGGTISHNESLRNGSMLGYFGGGVYVGSEGSFTMLDGTIHDNAANSGGGVFVMGSSFIMQGGSIRNNISSGLGGGVYIEGDIDEYGMPLLNGIFAMQAGSISNNVAEGGGGVFVGESNFTMAGSCIYDNIAEYGGGVFVREGTFTVTDSSIYGNIAENGGGVLVKEGSTFAMTSGSIRNNVAHWGGGVSIQYSFFIRNVDVLGGTFTMTGGSIHDNTAEYGGGVYVSGFRTWGWGLDGSFIMTGGSIHNNTAEYGGGVYVESFGDLTTEGGTIRDNLASRDGGGIFTSRHDYAPILRDGAYENLTIGSLTIFSGNRAGNGAFRPPSNWGITNIDTIFSSIFDHPLNNWDINFVYGLHYDGLPTVTEVVIKPDTASVQRGLTQQFRATVQGTNNPPQDVIWSVEGNSAGTTISADGLLTVTANETATILTVQATSTHTTTVFGTATVIITVCPIDDPPPVVFTANNPNVLKELLLESDVILQTVGNLGIFAHHSPFVIPEGRTLTVVSTLNVQGNAELIIEGNLVVQNGGRINNQGGAGGTIRIAPSGVLENHGHVENVTNSTVINYGTIINNGRFEVRAGTRFHNCGEIEGDLNVHRNVIRVYCERCEVS